VLLVKLPDSERGFSSAGFILSELRCALSVPHFRDEFRIRQYLNGEDRLGKSKKIVENFELHYKKISLETKPSLECDVDID